MCVPAFREVGGACHENWSYVCEDPACCPPEGKPFDVRDHPAARAMAAESARVLASRDALAATVAPVTGAAAEQMRQATKEAEDQVARAIARAARSGRKASVRRLIATVGLPAVAEGIRRYRGGRRLEPEEAAWLTVVLRDLRVRDDAWSRMRPEHREAHARLWTDLTRLAQPGYVCCPPEGKPFDVRDHPAARAMAAESARVLASRDALAATVAPVTGAAAGQMRQATKEAEEQVARAIARAARSGRKASVRRLIATVGLPAVSEGIRRYRGGRRLEPEEAAWLTVVLRDLRVRDDAWSRMRPEHREAHTRLWTDLTRLAQPGYVCAPAALLAFVAWQSGNGALANVALDRALAEDANYSMAVLLRQVIDSGAPPSLARLPMTPEDVAASYDALEASDEADGEISDEADEPADDDDEDVPAGEA